MYFDVVLVYFGSDGVVFEGGCSISNVGGWWLVKYFGWIVDLLKMVFLVSIRLMVFGLGLLGNFLWVLNIVVVESKLGNDVIWIVIISSWVYFLVELG